jgi:predicted Zn-dependent peptidase
MTKIKYYHQNCEGANVAFYPILGVHACSLQLKIKAGSWYEPDTSWGAFHLLEHLISGSSTARFKTHRQLELFLEKNGLKYDMSTGGSSVNFSILFTEKSLDSALEILEQIIFQPIFSTPDINRELLIIDREHSQKWSNVTYNYAQSLHNHLFGLNHPYSRDGMGQTDYIKNLSLSYLINLHSRYFVSPNISVGVSGPLDHSTLFSKLTKIFSRYPGTPSTLSIKPITTVTSPYYFSSPSAKSTDLKMIWLMPGADSFELKEFVILSLVKYLFTATDNSIFYRHLRFRLNLVYSIYIYLAYFPTACFLDIGTNIESSSFTKVNSEIIRLLNDFVARPISSRAYNLGLTNLHLGSLLDYSSVTGIAYKLVGDLFWEGGVTSLEDYYHVCSQITELDVRRFLETIISRPPVYSFMVPPNTLPLL